MSAYTLDEQYLEVQREIAIRKRVYPGWVENGRLTDEKATRQLGCMEAVLETVRKARQAEAMTSKLTGERIDAPAIAAAPELAGKRALVLYFETDEDRDGMIEACRAAMPNARTVKVP